MKSKTWIYNYSYSEFTAANIEHGFYDSTLF